MPTWLNGGCATGSLNAQGGLEVMQLPFDNVGEPRLLHSAGGTGQYGVGLAILASVHVGSQEWLLKQLAAIKPLAKTRAAANMGEEARVLPWLRTGGRFQAEACAFPLASNDGTGGATKAEHAVKCRLGLAEECQGLVTKGADGKGVAHSTEEWRGKSRLGLAEECQGRTIKGADGVGVAVSGEEHAVKSAVRKKPHKKQTSRAKEMAPRWSPTDSQLAKLQESFAQSAYPTRQVKEAFATQFGCTYNYIKRWFERQRQR